MVVKKGRNRGIWCGKVVSPVTVSHESGKDVKETYYRFEIDTEMKGRNGEESTINRIPVIVSKSRLAEIGKELMVGDIVFVKGPWRAHNTYDENGRMSVEQYAFAKAVELHEDYPTNTRNKLEFQGVLVKKLTEVERDEKGKVVRDGGGKPITSIDENGNPKYGIRINREGKIVNDYRIAVNRVYEKEVNGDTKYTVSSEYLYCLSYNALAQFVCEKIAIGQEVKGQGYLRERTYEKDGKEYSAYEIVVTELEKL